MIYCQKEAWNPEVAALGNSTLPTVCDKLNVMSTIHLRKLIATLVRENAQRVAVIDKLKERIGVLESRLNEMKKQPNTDVIVCATSYSWISFSNPIFMTTSISQIWITNKASCIV
ncbi:MAG: hypothetical protein WAM42_13745 [Candidatus Nitrosopolaris sp.]